MSQKLIDHIKDKKILLLGFGREGRSSYNYIRSYLPSYPLTIADKNPVMIDDKNVTVISGDNYLDTVNEYDIVFKSPGIAFCGVNISDDTEITCQTDLFMRFAPCVKIGITGTKGKTTTSTLIYEILKAADIPTCLIGNIGVPVLDLIDDVEGKTAVIEMSSHQLEFTRMSPHIAVFTNLYEEHLDHYDGFMGYANAKLNIVRYQNENDFFIYNKDQDLSDIYSLDAIRSKKLAVGIDDFKSSEFLKELTELNPRLCGAHSHQDAFFAAAAAKCLGISEENIKEGIKNFGGIEHRMEPVGTFGGIKFYNDAIATIPYAVMRGIEALGDTDTLIFGGLDRGLDYSSFCDDLIKSGVKNLIGLPETGHVICREIMLRGADKNIVLAKDMEEAVDKAFELTKKGKSCLLSPAAASYNRYRDFDEKGKHYKKLVREHS
ncbi:MAG: UDP-N-acetylmuramoyl-L-alanine--D-glutamate ligase [Clostridiales bacterium]|nr:UDP-N-acetylmuramoyl-L-alanine--D-glutamate ligase [Clostridiales bacterium]